MERLVTDGGEMVPIARDAIAKRRAELAVEMRRAQLPPPRVPSRFAFRRFEDDGRLGYLGYHPKNRSQAIALDMTASWCRDVIEGRRPMLALVGPTGVGKSHLAFAAAWELYEQARIRAYCIEWYRFVDVLRYGSGPRDERGLPQTRAWEARQEWWEQPVCILDELRRTSSTDFDASEAARYAQHAYAHELAVLVTTNESTLAEVMDVPAADRFTIHVLSGESQR